VAAAGEPPAVGLLDLRPLVEVREAIAEVDVGDADQIRGRAREPEARVEPVELDADAEGGARPRFQTCAYSVFGTLAFAVPPARAGSSGALAASWSGSTRMSGDSQKTPL